jgi:hypothetical protein
MSAVSNAASDRLCTDEELASMGRRTLDVLKEKIAAGDVAAATKLAERMHSEFQGMHDLYRDWVTDLLGTIGAKFGDAALADAIDQGVNRYTARFRPRYEGKDARRRLQMLAAGLRGHLEAFEIREEPDEFVISMTTCGSGGRLVRDGAYEGPDAFRKIAEPQAMTFGRADFPVYCAHCHFQNQAPVGPNGEPLMVTEPAQKLGVEPCRMRVKKY